MEDLVIDAAFWRGTPVFVTGHTGFKGSWLSLWLASLGANVSGYALPAPSQPSLYERAGVAGDVANLGGDVRDASRLRDALTAAAPVVVFHLAAQSLVRESYARPLETFETNVMGTANLLDAVRCVESVRAVVVVTSDKCYRNDGLGTPFAERDALGGDDPYSASKACAEIVTAAYRRSYLDASHPTASVRAGNVIGGGDWSADRIVPDTVAALRAGRSLALRNPQAVRPWQHVLDPLAGYVEIAQHLAAGRAMGAWNVGPSAQDARTVAELVSELARAWGAPLAWERDEAPAPAEQPALRLDAGKARRELGIRNRLPFAQACGWTARWYRRFEDGESARTLCLEQIRAYEALP